MLPTTDPPPSSLPPARRGKRRGTREAICAVAARSFATLGYHRASLHDIAGHVGIQKASLFHYFASKEALYEAVLAEGYGQVEEVIRRALAVEGGWLARARALLDAYIDLVASHPEQSEILLRQSLGDAPGDRAGSDDAERLLTLVTGFVADGQRAGAFAPVDGHSLVLGIVGMVIFLFTSGPVVAPHWHGALAEDHRVALIKRHVTTVVLRALACDLLAAAPTPRDRRDARDG